MGLGDDKVHSLDVPVKDFVSESSFPFTSSTGADEAATSRSFQDLFISAGRITDFATMLKLNIIQKLAPGLRKEGYEESSQTSNQSSSSDQGDGRRQPAPGREDNRPPANDPLREDPLPPYALPRPFDDPLAAGPRRPYPAGDFPPPGFEDEYEMNRPPGRGGYGGERRPLNIGERDLYPPGLGPYDPFRGGGYGPMGGIGGGGMHPTFDDPLFGGGGGVGGVGYDGR